MAADSTAQTKQSPQIFFIVISSLASHLAVILFYLHVVGLGLYICNSLDDRGRSYNNFIYRKSKASIFSLYVTKSFDTIHLYERPSQRRGQRNKPLVHVAMKIGTGTR